MQHNHYLYNPGKNYIEKNKSSLREIELENIIDKLKKENQALKLLLSKKSKNNYSNIPSKVYNNKPSSVPVKFRKKQIKLIKPATNNFNTINHNNINKNINKVNTINKQNEVILPKIESNDTQYENIRSISSISPIKADKNNNQIKNINNQNTININTIENNENNENNENIENIVKSSKNEKKLPKGVRYMNESQRIKRKEELESMKRDLEYELFKFPITRLSYKMQIRKSEIEKLLNNIEAELIKLSYKNVIIKDKN